MCLLFYPLEWQKVSLLNFVNKVLLKSGNNELLSLGFDFLIICK